MGFTDFLIAYWYAVAALVLCFFGVVWTHRDFTSSVTLSLSIEQLVHQVNRGHAVVVDIRSKEVYDAGTIAGAISCPEAACQGFAAVPKKEVDTKSIIYVCESGARAKRLAAQDSKQTNRQCHHYLEGGLQAWKKANMPIKTTGES